jgi:hypothetical protein
MTVFTLTGFEAAEIILRVVYFDPSWFRMAELIQSGIATVER